MKELMANFAEEKKCGYLDPEIEALSPRKTSPMKQALNEKGSPARRSLSDDHKLCNGDGDSAACMPPLEEDDGDKVCDAT